VYNLKSLNPKICKIHIWGKILLISVAIFDMKAQVLSILYTTRLMQPKHFSPNYAIFSRKPTSPVTQYGEVHSGNSFKPARTKYCGDDPYNVPFPMILMYDKIHLDIQSLLACSPVIMWPTFFNEECRNILKFT